MYTIHARQAAKCNTVVISAEELADARNKATMRAMMGNDGE